MPAFLRIRDQDPLPAYLRGSVVAIGNFDGVHRGHQAVLAEAGRMAAESGAPPLVMTFEPHPRKVFRPDLPLFVLTPPSVKARLFSGLGFDATVEKTFDKDFAALSAERFVSDILVDRLGIRHAVTGFDFHFGKMRAGGPAFLMAEGKRFGFAVTLVDAFRDENGEVISSSRIRLLLEDGDVSAAAGLLGYRYTVEGVVQGGQKLGREIGYPTANMRLPDDAKLRHGIYAVRLRRPDGSLHDGVASFGRRPTVEEAGLPLLETYLFDFSGNLYGENCEVSFFGFLRGEKKFDTLEALTAQIERDAEEARALLSGVAPLSPLDRHICF